jgi:hypothetical protein
MILRTGVIALLFTLFFAGCSTTKPEVWKAQDASFANFNTFEIQPVFNATNRPIKQDILSLLTAHLVEQFEKQNLQLTDTTQNKSGVLIVQIDILVYDANKQINVNSSGVSSVGVGGGKPRTSYCTLLTRLVNKSTTQVVAKILTSQNVSFRTQQENAQERVLKNSAAAVAKEVAKMMQSTEPDSSVMQLL